MGEQAVLYMRKTFSNVYSGEGCMHCLICLTGSLRKSMTSGWTKKQTPTSLLYYKLELKKLLTAEIRVCFDIFIVYGKKV